MSLIRRLASPAGLLLTLMCFAFPFLAVSCEAPVGSMKADISGVDMMLGTEPDVETTGIFAGMEDKATSKGKAAEDDGGFEPSLAVSMLVPAAFLSVVAALVLSVIPVAGLVLRALAMVAVAAAGVLAPAGVYLTKHEMVAEVVSRQKPGDAALGFGASAVESMIHVRYGLWVMLALLALSGLALAVDLLAELVRFLRRRAHGVPVATALM